MNDTEFGVGLYTKIRITGSLVTTRWPEFGEFEVTAVAQGTAEYQARARSLGYRDGEEMNREHDACHSILCCWLGLPFSPTLYGLATGEPAPERFRQWEEELVLAFQAWLNLRRYDPRLAVLPRLDLIAAQALDLLRS